MSRYRCRTCRGTYSDVMLDGTIYFHTCPDVINPAYEAQIIRDPDGTERSRPGFDPAIPRTIPRVNARDENVTKDANGKIVPRQEGQGRESLP